jgi:hypothetical protein
MRIDSNAKCVARTGQIWNEIERKDVKKKKKTVYYEG